MTYVNRKPLHTTLCLCGPPPSSDERTEYTCDHKRFWVKVRRRNEFRWIEKRKREHRG